MDFLYYLFNLILQFITEFSYTKFLNGKYLTCKYLIRKFLITKSDIPKYLMDPFAFAFSSIRCA